MKRNWLSHLNLGVSLFTSWFCWNLSNWSLREDILICVNFIAKRINHQSVFTKVYLFKDIVSNDEDMDFFVNLVVLNTSFIYVNDMSRDLDLTPTTEEMKQGIVQFNIDVMMHEEIGWMDMKVHCRTKYCTKEYEYIEFGSLHESWWLSSVSICIVNI